MTTIRTTNNTLAPTAKALNIALWTVQALVALAFLAAGSGKLLGSPAMIALFEAVGIGQWFRYVTGSLEVLGAFLLIIPGSQILIYPILWILMPNEQTDNPPYPAA